MLIYCPVFKTVMNLNEDNLKLCNLILNGNLWFRLNEINTWWAWLDTEQVLMFWIRLMKSQLFGLTVQVDHVMRRVGDNV